MKTFLGVIAVVFALGGCAAVPTAQHNQAANDKIAVVASFYPLAYMAEQIAGDAVRVTNIDGATDPHEYTPSPQDIATMHNADLVLLQGAGFESWGEDMVAQLEKAGVPVVEVAETLPLAKRETEDAHDAEHDTHGHSHGTYDPHTWLDPVLAQHIVTTIADAMVAVDPQHAEMFHGNATALNEKFVALDQAYTEGLAQCARNDVIVSHDAFGYLARRYGFTVHAIAGLSTQDEPSAAILADLKKEAAGGITHILTEENSVKRFAETLANETDLIILPVNVLATPSDDGRDFFARAQDNLTQLQAALGCSVQ